VSRTALRKLVKKKGHVWNPNPKVIILNLGLLVVSGWLLWMVRFEWIKLHAHEHTVLSPFPQFGNVITRPSPIPNLTPISALDYNEIAQKTLFAKDRNPNVIVEIKPTPPPPPPPTMPQLPVYYGMMWIGDPAVVFRLPKGMQKNYYAGEKVGPFLLVSFDPEKILFNWNGKTVERTPAELKENDPGAQDTAAIPVPAPVVTAISNMRTFGESPDNFKLGIDTGVGMRLCVPGDTSATGTVVDGYKKKIVNGGFGPTCLWEFMNP
jgi:hypothetical protein